MSYIQTQQLCFCPENRLDSIIATQTKLKKNA